MPDAFALRPGRPDDADWMAELKAEAMQPDLQRLGRWDPVWARRRFLDGYVPGNTSVIEVDGATAGIVAVRAEPDGRWIEHFYLHTHAQGRGLGGRVLAHVVATHPGTGPFRLMVVRGSAARRLYERHGFVHLDDHENGIDQILGR